MNPEIALDDFLPRTLRAIGASIRRIYVRYQRDRRAAAMYRALRKLDDRTLHDLGFHRSEISSVAAESTGATELTRRLPPRILV